EGLRALEAARLGPLPRHVTDHRKRYLFPVVGLDHQDDQQREHAETEQEPDRKQEKAQHPDVHERQTYAEEPEAEADDEDDRMEKQALERVKAHEAALF